MTSKINLAKRSRLWGSAAPSARAAGGAARGRERELRARAGAAPSGREAEGSPVKNPDGVLLRAAGAPRRSRAFRRSERAADARPEARGRAPSSLARPRLVALPLRLPRARAAPRGGSIRAARAALPALALRERSREGSADPVGASGHRPRGRSAARAVTRYRPARRNAAPRRTASTPRPPPRPPRSADGLRDVNDTDAGSPRCPPPRGRRRPGFHARPR